MRSALGLILFFSIILSSCRVVYHDPELERHTTLSSQERSFIAKFEDAVVKHKIRLLNDFLYPEYREEQLEKFYENDSKSFWNTFFCGREVDKPKKFTCLKLRNIREIYLIKVKPDSDNEKVLYFKVKAFDRTIIVSLVLKRYTDTLGQVRYGIIGAYG